MKFYIVAGEVSGDLHGSNLIRGLLEVDPSCEIRFYGGDLMAEAGGVMFRNFRDNAVMGVTEVISRAGKILGNLSAVKRDILAFNPDAVILVDCPGFNLRIARFAHSRNIRTYYYIAPKVWAHGEWRIRLLKKYVDKLFVIFPFEVEYFRSRGINAIYCGNPLLDILPFAGTGFHEGRTIALLAGSRKTEIDRLMPRYLALEKILDEDERFSGFKLVLACAPSVDMETYCRHIPAGSRIEPVKGDTYGVLSRASAAVVANGTANLEAALAGTPQVSCYAMNPITFFIARLLVKVDMVSLPNIILGRVAIKELLQKDADPQSIRNELVSILFDSCRRRRMLEDYEELRSVLQCGDNSSQSVSHRIAGMMIDR